MSFSAHADAKGIMQLIKNCEPKNVVLVHGENQKMDFLKNQIQKEYGEKKRGFLTMSSMLEAYWQFKLHIFKGIDCFKPANGETIYVKSNPAVPAHISVELLKNQKKKCMFEHAKQMKIPPLDW